MSDERAWFVVFPGGTCHGPFTEADARNYLAKQHPGSGAWLSGPKKKTCGDCKHLGGAPSRHVRYCEMFGRWEYALTPRGEAGPLKCDKFALAEPDPAT